MDYKGKVIVLQETFSDLNLGKYLEHEVVTLEPHRALQVVEHVENKFNLIFAHPDPIRLFTDGVTFGYLSAQLAGDPKKGGRDK